MNTATRLAQLNKACDGTLCIDSFGDSGWEVRSYGKDTPLNIHVKYPFIKDKDIKVAVKKAWEFVFEKEEKEADQEDADAKAEFAIDSAREEGIVL